MKLIDILRSLAQPVPKKLISYKTLKGNKIDYIAWYDLCDLLDDNCGIDGWEWSVKDVNQISNRLTLTGILTIHGDDKSLTRMATGTEDVDCSSYGDPSSNAEAMALRRCCSKFGLGRDLWRKENKNSNNYNFSYNSNKSTNKPIPKGQITREEWERRKLEKKEIVNPDHDWGVQGEIH
ncbi:Rad52/Rad22 family DNA repair protein [Crocosphaera sp.]|uniref:Rad52/Rad22 family DNA repair protein n=1 Tax=Crocosphaera sp. TaxID=2729996 RepID=UPI002606B3DE|nr:Rad52/Rad22 family DNA repair protein [Crocosphaera sp.]MDJ0583281.1 Rad52/Rad22 family DNA repair protein [Crocosphaera sp.]